MMTSQRSSRLLINESPLQVLPSLACAVGLNEAIFLQQLQYWLVGSKHEHDGHKWIYNSAPEWVKQFPFWSEPTIRRIVNSLRKQDMILVRDDLNKAAFDRTLWYTINYEALNEIIVSSGEFVTSCDQVDHTILSSCVDGDDQPDQSNTNRLPETTTIEKAAAEMPAFLPEADADKDGRFTMQLLRDTNLFFSFGADARQKASGVEEKYSCDAIRSAIAVLIDRHHGLVERNGKGIHDPLSFLAKILAEDFNTKADSTRVQVEIRMVPDQYEPNERIKHVTMTRAEAVRNGYKIVGILQ